MEEKEISFQQLFDTLYFERKLVALIITLFTLFGIGYLILATPIYQADLLIQIEDSGSSSKDSFKELSSLFEGKTLAAAEMEIVKSRKVVSHAVDNLHLDVLAEPKYFPIFGRWIAHRSTELSKPGLFGFGGFAWGTEQIEIGKFVVPQILQGTHFEVVAEGNGIYSLHSGDANIHTKGKVGELLTVPYRHENVELLISKLNGAPSVKFELLHRSHLATVERLQSQLNISEKGKGSGVISVKLEGANPRLIADELNEISEEYIAQNVARKSAEAEKSLQFLEQYLPSLKRSMEEAEERYIKLRNTKGTVDLTEEVKLTLQRSLEAQKKVAELRVKRDELLNRLTPAHPSVQALDAQIAGLQGELVTIANEIRKLPSLEREVLTVTRDVKISSELYTSLLNTSQQLRLVKAGKVASVRVVDSAVIPEVPIKPQKTIAFLTFIFVGIVLALVVAFVKKLMLGGIEDPNEIEHHTGLNVFASVPESSKQLVLFADVHLKKSGLHLLDQVDPSDPAIESLRSFRTALQFSMLDAKNNIVMITGATPGIGKSFISANFASVAASAGKRVLLVDLDLRKGYLNQYFGLERNHGISEYLLGNNHYEQVIHKQIVPNLDFISTGVLPSSPNLLLLHSNMTRFLSEVSQQYDMVVLDTPPVLAVTDAISLAHHCGTKILVAREGVTTLGEIGETVKRFTQIGEEINGIVFNAVRRRMSYGYAYGYGKYRYRNYVYHNDE